MITVQLTTRQAQELLIEMGHFGPMCAIDDVSGQLIHAKRSQNTVAQNACFTIDDAMEPTDVDTAREVFMKRKKDY